MKHSAMHETDADEIYSLKLLTLLHNPDIVWKVHLLGFVKFHSWKYTQFALWWFSRLAWICTVTSLEKRLF